MTLIKSISGIRGTIGGIQAKNLTPIDIIKFTTAYAINLKQKKSSKQYKVVIGRDARISGEMIDRLVTATFISMGIDVINIGLATTPTTAIAMKNEKANGGIIITASHNPKEWNALKMLNELGEMISKKESERILEITDSEDFNYELIDNLGKVYVKKDYHEIHINKILALDVVNPDIIKYANFKVVVDTINSVGGIAIPYLLKKLGIKQTIILHGTPDGNFTHNPEPLPENLIQLSNVVIKENADIGFAVDPDVDRLAIVNENGSMFGEEYTLVAIADYVLSMKSGNTVSNLSSTRALSEITNKHGGTYFASAVGELNVVNLMKEVEAIIGGEGNGGIIYPDSHYIRDALVGIAIFLTFLAKKNIKCSELRKNYPNYFMAKNKIEINNKNIDNIFSEIKDYYSNERINDTDGIKIDFENEWVHLRKSNTEPIVRVYAESSSQQKAELLSQKIINQIYQIIK